MAGFVTIACKIPNGIILRTGNFTEVGEPVLGGGVRVVRTWQADGKSISLKGPGRAKGEDPKAPISGGYAINSNVDADLWQRWFDENKESDMIKNHLIFAHVKTDAVTQMASDKLEVRSGMEPLKQKNDPRVPKSRALSIEPDDSRKSA